MRIPIALSAAVLSVAVLSGCRPGSGAAPVATPNITDCEAEFTAVMMTQLGKANSEAEWHAAMGKINKAVEYPSCEGLSQGDKDLVSKRTAGKLAPLVMSRALEWEDNK